MPFLFSCLRRHLACFPPAGGSLWQGVPRHKPLSVGVVLLDLVPYPSEDMIARPVFFDRIAEAHRRIEAGGLDGKLILCPERSP